MNDRVERDRAISRGPEKKPGGDNERRKSVVGMPDARLARVRNERRNDGSDGDDDDDGMSVPDDLRDERASLIVGPRRKTSSPWLDGTRETVHYDTTLPRRGTRLD